MRKLVAGAAMAAAITVSPALAADMRMGPLPGPYVAPPPPTWTGAYVGLNVGYQFGKVDNLPLKPNGVLGGIQSGYNWQTGQFVLGAETDLQLSSADDTFAPYQFSNPWGSALFAAGSDGHSAISSCTRRVGSHTAKAGSRSRG